MREDKTLTAFTRFVSRKMVAALAVFAVVAAALVGVAAARGNSGTTSVDLTSQAQALDAALADPAAALDGAALDGAALDGAADPTDPSGGWSRLRADLKAARALHGDARRAALADIRQKARDGSYGSGIERRADRRQIHRELFFSLLPDNLQADLTELKNAPVDQREKLRADIMDKALAGEYGADVQKAAEKLRDLRRG
jgi:hypothetical protein